MRTKLWRGKKNAGSDVKKKEKTEVRGNAPKNLNSEEKHAESRKQIN